MPLRIFNHLLILVAAARLPTDMLHPGLPFPFFALFKTGRTLRCVRLP